MVVVFLCSSIEPGRDGVGDYTRRLAGELIRKNHQVAIIALHDQHLQVGLEEGAQNDGILEIKTLRLSCQLSWNRRLRIASEFIKENNPDWISLQYVPFGFHHKGLPVRLAKYLKAINGDRKLHIMFHELWVGMSAQSPKRYVWWGMAQRYLVRLLLISLRPKVVHTHTQLYQNQLKKLGTQAFLLPLFSNIPLMTGRCNSGKGHTFKDNNLIKFVFFGGIFPGVPVNELADEVASYADREKVSVDLTIIGRSGPEQKTWTEAWRSRGLAIRLLGEQSPVNISQVLTQSTVGLSTTPVELAGKSGSIAAMHAHGLPVLCVSQPWQPKGIKELMATPGTFQYAIGNFESFMATYPNMYLPTIDIPVISQQFINSLLFLQTEQVVNNLPSSIN